MRPRRRYIYSTLGGVPLLLGASNIAYSNASAEPQQIVRMYEDPVAMHAEAAPLTAFAEDEQDVAPPELPVAAATGDRLGEGVASYYGRGFAGKATASGEAFDPAKMTAAHRTLPLGSIVKVSHGGKSVVVRINDRGPSHGNRVIDLSEGAARAIGIKAAGTGLVSLERMR